MAAQYEMPRSLIVESNRFPNNSQIIILGVCIALATVVSSVIISRSMMQIKKFSNEVINVTGSAEKNITSDYIVWRSEFSRRDAQLTAAFQGLKEDLKVVTDYLVSKGIPQADITASQISTQVLYRKNDKGNDTNEIEGYRLSQVVEVHSHDVVKVTDVSRESTELINQGIEFLSNSPEYFYQKLAELKLEMLSAATRDAKKRAEQIASSAGNRIGAIRAARMGVFQITPVNSYEVSDWGVNDTTSLEKKANAVVRVDFAIS